MFWGTCLGFKNIPWPFMLRLVLIRFLNIRPFLHVYSLGTHKWANMGRSSTRRRRWTMFDKQCISSLFTLKTQDGWLMWNCLAQICLLMSPLLFKFFTEQIGIFLFRTLCNIKISRAVQQRNSKITCHCKINSMQDDWNWKQLRFIIQLCILLSIFLSLNIWHNHCRLLRINSWTSVANWSTLLTVACLRAHFFHWNLIFNHIVWFTQNFHFYLLFT